MNYCKLTLLGNIGYLDQLKVLESKTQVLNFSVAHNESIKKDNGEYETETTWYQCSLWGKRAEYYSQKLSVGDKVLLEGTQNVSIHEGKVNIKVSVDNLKYEKKRITPEIDYSEIPF